MKKLGIMLLAIGLFAAYGTYRLVNDKQFRYVRTHGAVQASEDPEGYRGTLIIAGGMAAFGIIGGLVLIVRSK
ncbi:hypothetical protein [Aestuariibacter salexigens]|uniref:hypothetical protein n=1 Tax=Aestuariibacter salexigens TaxID=226010 RepID=UPI000407E211|nr:hypothetical protein [Aestuariibacter salexigens]